LSARVNWARLWRKAELDERRFDRALKGNRPGPLRKDHKAEGKANGKVGSLNR
jgi:hypothetical protein